MSAQSTESESLWSGVQDQTRRLADEVRGLAAARWRLLQLELTAARDQITRLLIVIASAGIAALVALPILLVALADALDGTLGLARTAWLVVGGATLLLGAIVSALLAWRRFRRAFTGLTESLEELREDLVWLSERRESSHERP